MADRIPTKDLVAALAKSPGNRDLRISLIDALLTDGEPATAMDHVLQGLEYDPDDARMLSLGAQTAVALENPLMAARFRKLVTAIVNRAQSDDYDDDQDESDDHPSRLFDAPAPFQLLRGGTSDAQRLVVQEKTLEDIVGLDTIKKNLREILESVKAGSKAKSSHTRPSNNDDSVWPGGVLFYGPPSCGKLFSTEVISGELDAVLWRFDFGNLWKRETLLERLDEAVDDAASRNVVLYMENVDNATSVLANEATLARIDEACDKYGLIVCGSATYPWKVPTSLAQPGRLGRVLLVLPPDAPSRRIFLQRQFESRALISSEDLDWLVSHTDGLTFGDMNRLVAVAIVKSDGDNLDVDDDISATSPLRVSHSVIRSARAVPPSSAAWLTTAGHHAMVNEEGGLYDDLLSYFRARQKH